MTAYCVPAGLITDKVCQYVQAKSGMAVPFDVPLCQAFAVFNEDDKFIGGVVVSNFRVIDCEISAAAETSIAWSPGVCRAVFRYIFWQLKCVRCTSITKKSNKKARAFMDHLGFKLEGQMRRAYDGERDALIYGLLAEECAFLVDPVDVPELDEEHLPGAEEAPIIASPPTTH